MLKAAHNEFKTLQKKITLDKQKYTEQRIRDGMPQLHNTTQTLIQKHQNNIDYKTSNNNTGRPHNPPVYLSITLALHMYQYCLPPPIHYSSSISLRLTP